MTKILLSSCCVAALGTGSYTAYPQAQPKTQISDLRKANIEALSAVNENETSIVCEPITDDVCHTVRYYDFYGNLISKTEYYGQQAGPQPK